jgi:catechol 2,3-dioxygenase-like lactoylglutathione lyase family enzyme
MIALTTPQPARYPQPTVKAQKLAYLIFERKDLEKAVQFLTDFGLHVVQQTSEEVFLRCADREPFCYRIVRAEQDRFIGFGLKMASRQDMLTISKLAGATRCFRTNRLGGGEIVRLTDPSGFLVEAVYGQTLNDPMPHRAALQLNVDTQHRFNQPQRLTISAPEVLRLGHVVLEVADFQQTCGWYTQHFGFIPSDVQVLPDGSPAVTFLRLDHGDTPTDHHTLALAQGFMPLYSHSAFEVVDADAVGMGQRVLRERGWQHAWGIGRHILGSQIFDYWQDAVGAKHEHYCDGDLFSHDVPMGVHAVSRDAMSQWGQSMPANFTKPKLNATALVGLVHHLRHSPDLTIRKLITLAKLFG